MILFFSFFFIILSLFLLRYFLLFFCFVCFRCYSYLALYISVLFSLLFFSFVFYCSFSTPANMSFFCFYFFFVLIFPWLFHFCFFHHDYVPVSLWINVFQYSFWVNIPHFFNQLLSVLYGTNRWKMYTSHWFELKFFTIDILGKLILLW